MEQLLRVPWRPRLVLSSGHVPVECSRTRRLTTRVLAHQDGGGLHAALAEQRRRQSTHRLAHLLGRGGRVHAMLRVGDRAEQLLVQASQRLVEPKR